MTSVFLNLLLNWGYWLSCLFPLALLMINKIEMFTVWQQIFFKLVIMYWSVMQTLRFWTNACLIVKWDTDALQK